MSLTLYLGHDPSGRVVRLPSADNPHVFVSGQSGSGKSHFMKKLVLQAVRQGALCVIQDYSGDFREFTPPHGLPFQHVDVTSSEFSLNPLAGTRCVDERAQRLLGVMHSVFRMGSRATTALHKVAKSYLEQDNAPTIHGLLTHIDTLDNVSKSLSNAVEPLELLDSLVQSGNQPIGVDLASPRLVVLDFSRVFDVEIQKFLVETVLRTIWDSRTSCQPVPTTPLIFVLDEAQNLAWGQNSMAIRILREGRKFGIGGWFSSQWTENKEATAALGQAALQAYFRPDVQHAERLARQLQHSGTFDLAQYRKLVRSLRRGQFLQQLPNGRVVLVNVEA